MYFYPSHLFSLLRKNLQNNHCQLKTYIKLLPSQDSMFINQSFEAISVELWIRHFFCSCQDLKHWSSLKGPLKLSSLMEITSENHVHFLFSYFIS
jgi:hypothetical protein